MRAAFWRGVRRGTAYGSIVGGVVWMVGGAFYLSPAIGFAVFVLGAVCAVLGCLIVRQEATDEM